jgi:hypothetical protein
MNELLQVSEIHRLKSLLDKIFNGFNVVVRSLFDLFDLAGISLRKLFVDLAYIADLMGRKIGKL